MNNNNTSISGPQDSFRVNTHEDREVEYWTNHFGITKEKLREAVQKVGNSVRDIEAYLKKK